ncbi:MAG: hypothetical protein GC192_17295 [Bacteroidetes bacterium]|nr:hypothetical protein [Bacteroidota bacterium]
MKNTFQSFLLLLLLGLVFIQCKTEPKRNRDIPYNDLETVMTNLSPLPQNFKIDPTEDNQITGKKGTAVFIPANVFRFEDGSVPTGEVQVELQESYTLTEMIGAGLHTMSDDRALETAGMIYVNATADGKPLKVQDGKAFVVSFPKNQQTEEMDLFYSLALEDSVETWVPDYEMFEVETRLAEMRDTVRGSGDTSVVVYFDKYENSDIRSIYPFELTEDLYDNIWKVIGYSTLLLYPKILNQKENLIDYVEKSLNEYTKANGLSYSDNDPTLVATFSIDPKGKIYDIKPTYFDTMFLNENDIVFKKFKEILEKAPTLDANTYFTKYKDYENKLELWVSYGRQLNQDRYKQKFRNQYADVIKKGVDKIDKQDLEFYSFAVTKLGWINCDRFLDMDASELTNFAVNTNSPNTADVRLIFKDLNSIMQGYYQDGKIVFGNISKGKAVKLVGISYADGKPMMATAETVVGEKAFELKGYQPFTLDEMEATLNN